MFDARLAQRLDPAADGMAFPGWRREAGADNGGPGPFPLSAGRFVGGEAPSIIPPDGVAPDLAGGGDAPGSFGSVEPEYALPRSLVAGAHHEMRRRLAAIIGALWAGVAILASAALAWAPLVLPALACAVTLIPLQHLDHFLSSVCAEAERRRVV